MYFGVIIGHKLRQRNYLKANAINVCTQVYTHLPACECMCVCRGICQLRSQAHDISSNHSRRLQAANATCPSKYLICPSCMHTHDCVYACVRVCFCVCLTCICTCRCGCSLIWLRAEPSQVKPRRGEPNNESLPPKFPYVCVYKCLCVCQCMCVPVACSICAQSNLISLSNVKSQTGWLNIERTRCCCSVEAKWKPSVDAMCVRPALPAQSKQRTDFIYLMTLAAAAHLGQIWLTNSFATLIN